MIIKIENILILKEKSFEGSNSLCIRLKDQRIKKNING
jgi:hypothetical protein